MSSQDTRDLLPARQLRPFDRTTGLGAASDHDHEHRLERLIGQLPERWRSAVCWLRRPAARWARIPAGVLFVIGGCLAILPILGLWMIPLGLILLAEDVPLLRRLRDGMLEWLERRRPHWFAAHRDGYRKISDKEETT